VDQRGGRGFYCLKSSGGAPSAHRILTQARAEAEGWFNGPPYALAKVVFDENDSEECSLAIEDSVNGFAG
jgi:hypothetical protein